MNKNLVLPYILVCHTCGAPNVPHLHLVYRDEEQFLKLAPDRAPPGSVVVKPDATGVNIFLEVRKPLDA